MVRVEFRASEDVTRVNLVPMAGQGNRFRRYGYRVAKPLIQVRGKPMVVHAAASMPEADQFIFWPERMTCAGIRSKPASALFTRLHRPARQGEHQRPGRDMPPGRACAAGERRIDDRLLRL